MVKITSFPNIRAYLNGRELFQNINTYYWDLKIWYCCRRYNHGDNLPACCRCRINGFLSIWTTVPAVNYGTGFRVFGESWLLLSISLTILCSWWTAPEQFRQRFVLIVFTRIYSVLLRFSSDFAPFASAIHWSTSSGTYWQCPSVNTASNVSAPIAYITSLHICCSKPDMSLFSVLIHFLDLLTDEQLFAAGRRKSDAIQMQLHPDSSSSYWQIDSSQSGSQSVCQGLWQFCWHLYPHIHQPPASPTLIRSNRILVKWNRCRQTVDSARFLSCCNHLIEILILRKHTPESFRIRRPRRYPVLYCPSGL